MADTFDYVVVGSGAAGSVLCNRLTEDPERHRLRAGMRAARPAPLHPHPGRLHQDAVQPGLHLAVPDRTGRGHQRPPHPHHAGPHARRVELDQRHDLQPRPARGFRQLGAARQSRLGLCRHPALLQARRAAPWRRRRPHPRPRAALCRSPTTTGSIRRWRRSSRVPRNSGCRAASTTTAATARWASATSSA